MGKHKRSKPSKEDSSKAPVPAATEAKIAKNTKKTATASNAVSATPNSYKNSYNAKETQGLTTYSNIANPLLEQQANFIAASVTPSERDNFFSPDHVTPQRRAELWTMQADLGEQMVNRYSWATPDNRALRILSYFSPIVEIGCGSNAYWCNLMQHVGVDVIAYDISPGSGGKIQSTASKSSKDKAKNSNKSSLVRSGGPEVLADHKHRTLFLCYPDEVVMGDANDDGGAESMAEACLEHYKGDCIIHVGELFLDATFSMEQAPWGRSSSPAFQERLAAEFHCILRATLPNWLHTSDRITVWKRSPTIIIAYEDDEDRKDGSRTEENNESHGAENEVIYRHIPKEERLPVDTAAPCVAHLLKDAPVKRAQVSAPRKSASPKRTKRKSSDKKSMTPPVVQEPYACPW